MTRLVSTSRAVWYQEAQLANILVESSDLGRGFLEVRGAAIYFNNPSLFKEKLLEAKQCHSDQEKSGLVHAGALTSEDAPGAEKRANKRSSRLAALDRLSALWTTRSPRLALAGVITTDDMLSDRRYSADASEIEAGIMPYGSGEFIVSRPEHMMEMFAGR